MGSAITVTRAELAAVTIPSMFLKLPVNEILAVDVLSTREIADNSARIDRDHRRRGGIRRIYRRGRNRLKVVRINDDCTYVDQILTVEVHICAAD